MAKIKTTPTKKIPAPKSVLNPWMLSTIVLAVLVVGFFAGNLYSGGFSFGGPKYDLVMGERSGGASGSEGYGDPSAPVTIIEFSDFQCPYCKRFFDNTLSSVESAYITTGKARMVYKDFPLSFHANAKPAAVAARCAGKQGNFWGMHDAIFLNHEKWTEVPDPTPVFAAMAKKLKLKKKKFAECLVSTEFDAQINADMNEGRKAGIGGTPGFFVNGEKIDGAVPFSVFESVIESKLNPSAATEESGE